MTQLYSDTRYNNSAMVSHVILLSHLFYYLADTSVDPFTDLRDRLVELLTPSILD